MIRYLILFLLRVNKYYIEYNVNLFIGKRMQFTYMVSNRNFRKMYVTIGIENHFEINCLKGK